MKLNTGIAPQDRETIAAGLSRLLADSYTLYLKTHNFHWNVTGPQFNTLHLMFEGQYTELAAAVDEIAERIRALGVKAPPEVAFEDAELSAMGRSFYGENKRVSNAKTKDQLKVKLLYPTYREGISHEAAVITGAKPAT